MYIDGYSENRSDYLQVMSDFPAQLGWGLPNHYHSNEDIEGLSDSLSQGECCRLTGCCINKELQGLTDFPVNLEWHHLTDYRAKREK